jgi:putative transposase
VGNLRSDDGNEIAALLSPEARTIVLNALRHFHNTRYELFAACVMPDHVHMLLQPWPKENDPNGNVVFWSLSDLLHSIKSFSAHQLNKLEQKTGGVWEKERFDPYVRSDSDLQEKFHYILRNPWDTGMARPNEIIRGSGHKRMNCARKVRRAGTARPARGTRALPNRPVAALNRSTISHFIRAYSCSFVVNE